MRRRFEDIDFISVALWLIRAGIILLVAWSLRTIPTWRLIMLFTPIIYVMLCLKNDFIIRYWNWHWVS